MASTLNWLQLPRWWPRLVWRHDAAETFGYSPITRLLGVGFGTEAFVGFVGTRQRPTTPTPQHSL